MTSRLFGELEFDLDDDFDEDEEDSLDIDFDNEESELDADNEAVERYIAVGNGLEALESFIENLQNNGKLSDDVVKLFNVASETLLTMIDLPEEVDSIQLVSNESYRNAISLNSVAIEKLKHTTKEIWKRVKLYGFPMIDRIGNQLQEYKAGATRMSVKLKQLEKRLEEYADNPKKSQLTLGGATVRNLFVQHRFDVNSIVDGINDLSIKLEDLSGLKIENNPVYSMSKQVVTTDVKSIDKLITFWSELNQNKHLILADYKDMLKKHGFKPMLKDKRFQSDDRVLYYYNGDLIGDRYMMLILFVKGEAIQSAKVTVYDNRHKYKHNDTYNVHAMNMSEIKKLIAALERNADAISKFQYDLKDTVPLIEKMKITGEKYILSMKDIREGISAQIKVNDTVTDSKNQVDTKSAIEAAFWLRHYTTRFVGLAKFIYEPGYTLQRLSYTSSRSAMSYLLRSVNNLQKK